MAILVPWRILSLFICALALCAGVGAADTATPGAGATDNPGGATPALAAAADGQRPFVDGEVLVRFRPDAMRGDRSVPGPAARAHARTGGRVARDFTPLGLEGAQLVRLPANLSVEAALAKYREDPDVLYAEPNYIVHTDALPNDPALSLQWALRNTGQTVDGQRGTVGADIDASPAWEITTGSGDVLVAVIDTGIDYTHPDLAANVWTNPREIAGNRVDDDRNGYVDDVRGWDFRNDDADPRDDHGHGTHNAGTIGASGNNRIGGAGVTQRVRLLPLKFLGSTGRGNTADEVEAILYARAAGADIVCCSFGSGLYSATERNAIEGTSALFLCAAGNTADNVDVYPEYPASYPSGNIVGVTATDNRDQLAAFASYGKSTVDLGVPGAGIYSTMPGGRYGYMSGTSMATAMASGAAALVKAAYPALSPAGVRTLLLRNADPLPSLAGRAASGGRLNVYRAIAAGGAIASLTPSFTVSPASGTAPLEVRFTDTSAGAPISWAWNFGDGQQSSERNPFHTYRSAGTYSVSLTVRNAAGTSRTLTRSGLISVTVNGPVTTTPAPGGSGPYRTNAVPGRVEAEHYDLGGEGVAYHDTTPGNAGGVFRTDDVDIERVAAEDSPSIGWIRNGEWLTYTLTVAQSGTYTLRARVASPGSGRTISLSVDGASRATVAVPTTGGFGSFATIQAPLTLSAGTRVLRVAFAGDGQNLNWLDLSLGPATTPTAPPSGSASFSAAPLTAPRGTGVRFAVTPRPGKTVASAWWSFDYPNHAGSWNSRTVNPTFYYPATGTFSPYVKLTYTDGTTDTVHRVGYVRIT